MPDILGNDVDVDMTPSQLRPIDTSGPSYEVHKIIAEWLYNHVNKQKYYDIKAGIDAVRVIVAFAELENTGSIEKFREKLWGEKLECGHPSET